MTDSDWFCGLTQHRRRSRQVNESAAVTMLPQRWRLHDIEDVEAYTGAIVHRRSGGLSQDDCEDLHVYLIETAWELSTRYQPGKASVSFSTYAGNVLALRVTDWQRKRFGRTKWRWSGRSYEKAAPTFVSLDADGVRDRLEAELQRLSD